MRTLINLKKDYSDPKPTYIQQLPKRNAVKDRKKIRQLLRSMLPMEGEQRQIQEEKKLFNRSGKAK